MGSTRPWVIRAACRAARTEPASTGEAYRWAGPSAAAAASRLTSESRRNRLAARSSASRWRRSRSVAGARARGSVVRRRTVVPMARNSVPTASAASVAVADSVVAQRVRALVRLGSVGRSVTPAGPLRVLVTVVMASRAVGARLGRAAAGRDRAGRREAVRGGAWRWSCPGRWWTSSRVVRRGVVVRGVVVADSSSWLTSWRRRTRSRRSWTTWPRSWCRWSRSQRSSWSGRREVQGDATGGDRGGQHGAGGQGLGPAEGSGRGGHHGLLEVGCCVNTSTVRPPPLRHLCDPGAPRVAMRSRSTSRRQVRTRS